VERPDETDKLSGKKNHAESRNGRGWRKREYPTKGGDPYRKAIPKSIIGVDFNKWLSSKPKTLVTERILSNRKG